MRERPRMDLFWRRLVPSQPEARRGFPGRLRQRARPYRSVGKIRSLQAVQPAGVFWFRAGEQAGAADRSDGAAGTIIKPHAICGWRSLSLRKIKSLSEAAKVGLALLMQPEGPLP